MHLQKGISKMAALGAVMYKILRIVYGVLKKTNHLIRKLTEQTEQEITALIIRTNQITEEDISQWTLKLLFPEGR